jgi:5'(3')-deoxyribonucleotidase
MDNVLVDFSSGIAKLDPNTVNEFQDRLDEVPGIFSLMDPLKNAVASFEILSDHYNTFILSTAPWDNPSAWTDKLLWVKKHLGQKAFKKLILTHRKDLNKGHYLIDDREKNGAGDFDGELILFGSEKFSEWIVVRNYLLSPDCL